MRLLFVARKLAFRNPGFWHLGWPAGLRAIKKKGLWLVACGWWPWLVAVARACGYGGGLGLWPRLWPGFLAKALAYGFGQRFVAMAMTFGRGLGLWLRTRLWPWAFGFCM